ncbi:MAG: OmpA family protein [Acidobacteria bacterium]|nr:OmpA family protein [Acidobacteriota bacterium]
MSESDAGANHAAVQPIIIKRVKGGHGGHHGGAWKVAYADFVTAMMALFIVLWLMNSSKEIQQAVGGYFRDPTGQGKQVGSGQNGTGDGLEIGKDDMPRLKEEIEKAINDVPQLADMKEQVAMTVTGEGLRIELMESETGTFFETGSSKPSDNGGEMLAKLATELGKLPNKILIEGHTDRRPFAGGNNYSNWELSVDRANAARRLMQAHGLNAGQVTQVRGFADQRLRKPDDPENASNRRISLIVQYVRPPATSTDKEAGGKGKAGSGHGGPGGKGVQR